MKLISLTRGLFTKVDDADYEWLSQWKWSIEGKTRLYAVRGQWDGQGVRHVSMSRLILGLEKGDPRQPDHINRDTLDNQRANLRIATASENARNRRLLRSDNTSGFRGVHVKPDGRFQSYIYHHRKRIHLGYFVNVRDAIAARDAKAKELHGEFAVLNGVING
jgi:hypothetical protein